MKKRFMWGLTAAVVVAFAVWCLAGLSPWIAEIPGVREWWNAQR